MFWNPLSITVLIHTILGGLITIFFFRQLLNARREGKTYYDAACLFVMFAGSTVATTLQVLSDSLGPQYSHYALAWVSPPVAISMSSFIVFAYIYQNPTRTINIGSVVLGVVLLAIISAEFYVAIARHLLLLEGVVEFRDAWLDFPFALGFLLAHVFLFAGIAKILARDRKNTWFQSILPALKAVLWPSTRLPPRAAAARAFFYFALIPIFMGVVSLLRSYGYIDWRITEVLLGWLYLLVLSSFALAYLNYVPERSSFKVKVVGVTLTAYLAIICGVVWLIGGVHIDEYKSENQLLQDTAIRFDPRIDGSYSTIPIDVDFETNVGDRIDTHNDPIYLPFTMPFYGKFYTIIYPNMSGIVGFEQMPLWRDIQHNFGPQPTIFIGATKLSKLEREPKQSGLFYLQEKERIVLTWRRLVSSFNPDDIYTFQLQLYKSGRIEFAYFDLPTAPKYDIYLAHSTPMLTGIVPDWPARNVEKVKFASELPFSGSPGQGIVWHHRIEFLTYLDRVFEPVMYYILAASLFLLIIFPYFFIINLDQPLKKLIGGVQQVLSGNLSTRIEVTHRDEIGFLAESFNEMTKTQHDLIQNLEEKVASRTAEAKSYADENVRLEERNLLSQELHDAVSQTLFSANLMADTMPGLVHSNPKAVSAALEEIRALNKNALVEMRNLLIELRSKKLTTNSLGQLVAELIEELRANCAIDVQFQLDGDANLPEDVQHVFYRIAQECLSNVTKHSNANEVTIYLDSMSTQAILSVKDNGNGFDIDHGTEGSFGLQIMRERVDKIGGSLEIETLPNSGTSIVAIWISDNDEK